MASSTVLSSPSCPTPTTASAPPGFIPVSGDDSLDYCVLSAPVANSSQYMESCCSPNILQVAGGCYNWCQIPDRFLQKGESRADVNSAFLQCLRTSSNGELPNVGLQCVLPSVSGAHGPRACGGSLMMLLLTLLVSVGPML